jgi:ABC-type multidrug transport system fused ATPase/permease subunit
LGGEASKIIISLIFFVFITCTTIALSYISGICVSKLSANVSKDLKKSIGRVLLGAKYGEIVKMRSGDILSSVNSDTGAVCDFVAGDLTGLFSQ